MIVVAIGAQTPVSPPKRDAKRCCGDGGSPGVGTCSGGSTSISLSWSLTRPPRPAAAAGHREPELLLGRRRRELADDAALVDHEDAVGEREDLLELE